MDSKYPPLESVKKIPVRHSRSFLVAAGPSRSSLLVGTLLCLIVTLVLVTLLLQPVFGQKKLSAAEAKNHIGETATVCGNAIGTRYATSTRGQPMFLNLDKPY